MPTDTDMSVSVTRLQLEFEVGGPYIAAEELAQLLFQLNWSIRTIVHEGFGIEGLFSNTSYLVLAGVQYGSPLKFLGAIPKLPAKAKAALMQFFNNIIFYEETRELKRAQAALGWEEVYAKRIENVKAVLDLLPEQRTPEKAFDLVQSLMHSTEALARQPAKLKGFIVSGDDE